MAIDKTDYQQLILPIFQQIEQCFPAENETVTQQLFTAYLDKWEAIAGKLPELENMALQDVTLLFVDANAHAFNQSNELTEQHRALLQTWHTLFNHYLQQPDYQKTILGLIRCLNDEPLLLGLTPQDEEVLAEAFVPVIEAFSVSQSFAVINQDPVPESVPPIQNSDNLQTAENNAFTPINVSKNMATLWQKLRPFYHHVVVDLTESIVHQQQHDLPKLKASLQRYAEQWLNLAKELQLAGGYDGLLDIITLFIEISSQAFRELENFDKQQLVLKTWQQTFAAYFQVHDNQLLAQTLVRCLSDTAWGQLAITAEDEEMLLTGLSTAVAPENEPSSKPLVSSADIADQQAIELAKKVDAAFELAMSELETSELNDFSLDYSENTIWEDVEGSFNQASVSLQTISEGQAAEDSAGFHFNVQCYIEHWQEIADMLANHAQYAVLADVVLLFVDMGIDAFVQQTQLSNEQFSLLNQWHGSFSQYLANNDEKAAISLVQCLKNSLWAMPIDEDDEKLFFDGLSESAAFSSATESLAIENQEPQDESYDGKIARLFAQTQQKIQTMATLLSMTNVQACTESLQQYADNWTTIATIASEQDEAKLQLLAEVSYLFAGGCAEWEQNTLMTEAHLELLQQWQIAFASYFHDNSLQPLIDCLGSPLWLQPLTETDKEVLLATLEEQQFIKTAEPEALIFSEAEADETESFTFAEAVEPESNTFESEAVRFNEAEVDETESFTFAETVEPESEPVEPQVLTFSEAIESETEFFTFAETVEPESEPVEPQVLTFSEAIESETEFFTFAEAIEPESEPVEPEALTFNEAEADETESFTFTETVEPESDTVEPEALTFNEAEADETESFTFTETVEPEALTFSEAEADETESFTFTETVEPESDTVESEALTFSEADETESFTFAEAVEPESATVEPEAVRFSEAEADETDFFTFTETVEPESATVETEGLTFDEADETESEAVEPESLTFDEAAEIESFTFAETVEPEFEAVEPESLTFNEADETESFTFTEAVEPEALTFSEADETESFTFAEAVEPESDTVEPEAVRFSEAEADETESFTFAETVEPESEPVEPEALTFNEAEADETESFTFTETVEPESNTVEPEAVRFNEAAETESFTFTETVEPESATVEPQVLTFSEAIESETESFTFTETVEPESEPIEPEAVRFSEAEADETESFTFTEAVEPESEPIEPEAVRFSEAEADETESFTFTETVEPESEPIEPEALRFSEAEADETESFTFTETVEPESEPIEPEALRFSEAEADETKSFTFTEIVEPESDTVEPEALTFNEADETESFTFAETVEPELDTVEPEALTFSEADETESFTFAEAVEPETISVETEIVESESLTFNEAAADKPDAKVLETEDDFSARPVHVNPELVGMVRDEFAKLADELATEMALAPNLNAFKELINGHQFKVENLAKACQTIGLLGLEQVFTQLSLNMCSRRATDPELTQAESDLFKIALPLTQYYLEGMNDVERCAGLVNHLQNPIWRHPLPKAQINPLIGLLAAPISGETREALQNRKVTAELADVSLQLPSDVNSELLDSLLSELPVLTSNFSAMIQQIIFMAENDVQQLLDAQRIAHTLKGSGNIVGVAGIAVLTHHLEEILEYLTEHKKFPTKALGNVLLESADCLEMMCELMLNGEQQAPEQAMQVLQNVLDWANQIALDGLPAEDVEIQRTEVVAPVEQAPAPVAAVKAAESVAMLRVPSELVDSLLRMTGEANILNEQFKDKVERFADELKNLNSLTWQMQALVSELDQFINIQSYSAKKSNLEAVNTTFDALEMEQYNELHTASSRIAEMATDIREVTLGMETQLVDLHYLMVEEHNVQQESQDKLHSIRMVPASTIVSRCQRIVRQACRATNKEVDLEILGADILIDSEILNDMVDPLMHLLRNSVDHGIEPPHIREKSNKSPVGKITLEFRRQGNYAVLSCKDDGGGLASGNILQTAIKKGLIAADQELTEAEIHQLILIPGFSTRAVATQTSGRGIGMDAIQTKISSIQGQMSLFSVRGQGLTIEITIPLTLTSMLSLLVKCNGQTMAISNRGLRKIYHADDCTLVKTKDHLWCDIDYERYASKYFAELVGMPFTVDVNKKLPALRIEDEIGKTRIVFVDELLGYRDLLVKNMGAYIPHIQGVTGASILGNGNVAPVIDLVEMLHHSAKYEYVISDATKALADNINGLPIALVVDDSLSARKAVTNLLRDSGITVETAIDGMDAIKQIEKIVPDILIVDLEMPRMNGIELSLHIRGREDMKHTPIIMITSRATEKHRKQAEAAGVTEFMTKPFTEDDLIYQVKLLLDSSKS